MKRRSVVSQRVKYLLMGIIIGITFMLSAVVFANSSVTALLNNGVTFFFNGEKKALPEGYDVLVYKGRTYTPARFVAEELGAEVLWDEGANSIFINYEAKTDEDIVSVPETTDTQEVDTNKDVTEIEKDKTDKKDYQKLPIYKATYEAIVTVTHVDLDTNATIVYLEIEGRNVPVQLNRGESTMVVGNVVYDQSDQSRIVDPIDTRWYNDIREDQKVSGWIKFPPISKDTKNMTINLEIFRNDGSNEVTRFEFDIAL